MTGEKFFSKTWHISKYAMSRENDYAESSTVGGKALLFRVIREIWGKIETPQRAISTV